MDRDVRAELKEGSFASWKPYLGTAGGVVIGVVFLVAVFAKAPDPATFAEQVRMEGLDFLLPAYTVALIALGLEAGLGTLLILGVRLRWVLYPTAGLVLFFLFLTGRNYWYVAQGWRDPSATCGCFGNLIERTPAQAFWQDLFILGPALILAFVGLPAAKRTFPVLRASLAAFLTVGVVLFARVYGEPPLDQYRVEAAHDLESYRFEVLGDYLLVVDGRPVDEEVVFYSDDTSAFLIETSALPDALLLSPRNRSVARLERDSLNRSSDGARLLPVRHRFETVGEFEMGPEGVRFSLDGSEVRLQLRDDPVNGP